MKVLKKENTENWHHIAHCSNCNSELEVEAKDLIYYRYDGDFRDPGYDSFTASCAVCSHSLTIPINSIPKLIQHEAKNRANRSHTTAYYDR